MITIFIIFIAINMWGILGYKLFMETMDNMVDFTRPLRLIDIGYYFVCGPWVWIVLF